MSYFGLIMVGVLLNAAAQILLKSGMMRIGHFEFNWNALIPIGLQAALTPAILLGLFCYVLSVVIWMAVLSRVEVSVAYPMVSIGYIVAAVAGWYFFGEALSAMRIGGIFVIILGVYMVSKTA